MLRRSVVQSIIFLLIRASALFSQPQVLDLRSAGANDIQAAVASGCLATFVVALLLRCSAVVFADRVGHVTLRLRHGWAPFRIETGYVARHTLLWWSADAPPRPASVGWDAVA